jgi:hypothetical protein
MLQSEEANDENGGQQDLLCRAGCGLWIRIVVSSASVPVRLSVGRFVGVNLELS